MISNTMPQGLRQAIGLIRDRAAPERLRAGLERQRAVAENRRPDYLPLIFSVNSAPELEQLTRYDFEEEFASDAKMLANQLSALAGFVLAGSDAQLCVRANMGTPFLATVFGLRVRTFPHTLPWLVEHLGSSGWRRADLPAILDSLPERGLFPRALSVYDYYEGVLCESELDALVRPYLPDTQGVFDLAHLIIGDEFFTLLRDDPGLADQVIGGCTALYVGASRLFKRKLAEPPGRAYHGGGLYLARAGVRSCDDTSTLVSAADVERFALPGLRAIGREFEGVFLHFCGRSQHLLDSALGLSSVNCVNFGNPENYDFAWLLPRLAEAGKYYVGSIPRRAGEDDAGYFTRILGYLRGRRQGLALMPDLEGEAVDEARARTIMTQWHDLQDRYLA